jgi:arginase
VPDASAREAVDRLSRPGLNGFWIHLDADALDDAIMPAVDYRLPDGLSWRELDTILHTALACPKAVGMEVTIFNPHLDDGRLAGSLVEALRRAFAE